MVTEIFSHITFNYVFQSELNNGNRIDPGQMKQNYPWLARLGMFNVHLSLLRNYSTLPVFMLVLSLLILFSPIHFKYVQTDSLRILILLFLFSHYFIFIYSLALE